MEGSLLCTARSNVFFASANWACLHREVRVPAVLQTKDWSADPIAAAGTGLSSFAHACSSEERKGSRSPSVKLGFERSREAVSRASACRPDPA